MEVQKDNGPKQHSLLNKALINLKNKKDKASKEYSEKTTAFQKQHELDFIKENFEKLSTPIKNLGLSIRTVNCLFNLEIKDVGELIQFSENYLLRSPNFGRKSLKEIENLLVSFGLNFNTKIKWPPENYADLIKKLKNSIAVVDSKSKKFKRIEINENSLNKELLMDVIKSSLKEREYLILKKRFWEGQTLEEIAQIEKVTRERIRQIEAKSLKKIRKHKLMFSKFLELKKDEIFSEYSCTPNLVTDESLSKVKKKYPLNEYDGLIFLCFEMLDGVKKYERSLIQSKRSFFNKILL